MEEIPTTPASIAPIEALLDDRYLLDALLEHSPDHIYFKDRRSRFLRVSRSLAEWMGLGDPLEAIGHSDADFFAAAHAEKAQMDEDVILRTGRPLVGIEEREVWPDGRETWVSTTKAPLRDRNGELVGVFGMSRDITARKRTEAQMIAAQKLESLGVLAGGIAHDFNNLLLVVLGNAGIVRDGLPPDSPLRRNLTDIETAGERAADLTRQMLAYSGKSRCVVEPIDIGAFVQEIAGLLHAAIPRKVALLFSVAPELPVVEADASQMTQLVMNLIMNAAESIGEDAGTIHVTASAIDASAEYLAEFESSAVLQPGRYVVLEVTDTGCGMDEATKARIFEPFFTTKFTGRGLGLAATLGIIRGHRGAIRLVTSSSQGSSFTIVLPAAPAERSEPKPPREVAA